MPVALCGPAFMSQAQGCAAQLCVTAWRRSFGCLEIISFPHKCYYPVYVRVGGGRGGSPSVFSNKSKLKLKPIKDSSIGMLSRALEPAGNKLLTACATMQGDKTSFSAAVLGGGMGAHCTHCPHSGWGWLVAVAPGGRRGRAGQKPMPRAHVAPPGPLSAHCTR